MLKGSAGKTLVDVGSGYWEFLEVTLLPVLLVFSYSQFFRLEKIRYFLDARWLAEYLAVGLGYCLLVWKQVRVRSIHLIGISSAPKTIKWLHVLGSLKRVLFFFSSFLFIFLASGPGKGKK